MTRLFLYLCQLSVFLIKHAGTVNRFLWQFDLPESLLHYSLWCTFILHRLRSIKRGICTFQHFNLNCSVSWKLSLFSTLWLFSIGVMAQINTDSVSGCDKMRLQCIDYCRITVSWDYCYCGQHHEFLCDSNPFGRDSLENPGRKMHTANLKR